MTSNGSRGGYSGSTDSHAKTTEAEFRREEERKSDKRIADMALQRQEKDDHDAERQETIQSMLSSEAVQMLHTIGIQRGLDMQFEVEERILHRHSEQGNEAEKLMELEVLHIVEQIKNDEKARKIAAGEAIEAEKTQDEIDEEECPSNVEKLGKFGKYAPKPLAPDPNKIDPIIALSGSKDRVLKLWSIRPGFDIKKGEDTEMATYRGHSGSIFGVVAEFVSGEALSSSSDETCKLWDLKGGESSMTLSGHTDAVNSVACDFARRQVVSGSYDRSVKLWDLRARACTATLTGHTGAVNAVAADFARGEALSGADDGELWLWDLRVQSRRKAFKGHKNAILAMVADFERGEVLTGSSDRWVVLWDLKKGGFIHKMHGHKTGVHSLAADLEFGQALSGAEDGELRLWNLKEGTCIDTVGHQFTDNEKEWLDEYADRQKFASVSALCANFVRGQAITAGSQNGGVRLWDVDKRRQEGRAKGHTGTVFAVAADFSRGDLGSLSYVD